MVSSNYFLEAGDVKDRLAKAWEFLSGEQRSFQCLADAASVADSADFSFFMPLGLANDSRQGGVAVLMQRGDAMQVAANMFGVAQPEVSVADLGDACAEVCNVLSDCLMQHFAAGQDVKIGLPRAAGPLELARLAEKSVVQVMYQGRAGALSLLIVLYDGLRSPP